MPTIRFYLDSAGNPAEESYDPAQRERVIAEIGETPIDVASKSTAYLEGLAHELRRQREAAREVATIPIPPRPPAWRAPLPNSPEAHLTPNERALPLAKQPLRGQLIRRMKKGI